jgi:hypothetical protein
VRLPEGVTVLVGSCLALCSLFFSFFLLRLPERVTVLIGSCQHLLGLVHLLCVVCVCVRETVFNYYFILSAQIIMFDY